MPIEWKVAGASATGFSHQEEGTPCQDFHAIGALPDGWLVATVADGAGSAPRSAEGARAICEGVVAALSGRLSQIDPATCAGLAITARPWIEDSIDFVRSALLRQSDDLRDFHATLVGVIAAQSGGIFFHIGDGAACAFDRDCPRSSVISMPMNGQYANETFFFTENNWKSNLRFTPFGSNFTTIALMSDGVTAFALAPGGRQPYMPFFDPVSRYMEAHTREEGEVALIATLQRDDIRAITGDDKTLVWALKAQTHAG